MCFEKIHKKTILKEGGKGELVEGEALYIIIHVNCFY